MGESEVDSMHAFYVVALFAFMEMTEVEPDVEMAPIGVAGRVELSGRAFRPDP